MRVFLIGYMGSGKSTLGPRLADGLGYSFFDLDDIFEVRFKISIHDFFQKYGEKHFREIESSLLRELGTLEKAVIATGGGTPCFHENMVFMKQNGMTIYLRLPVDTLINRLKVSLRKRPVLKNFRNPDYENQIREHLAQREEYYLQSDIIVEEETPNASTILDRIRNQFPIS